MNMMGNDEATESLEIMDIPKNTMFMYGHKLDGWTAEEVRNWLSQHKKDQPLADMAAQVMNHMGELDHASSTDSFESDIYEQWSSLEKDVVDEILKRTGTPNTGIAWRDAIAPFMEAHGYRDGKGWWVTSSNDDKRPASVYVGVDCAKARQEILDLFAGCDIIEHFPGEDKYDYLEEGEIEYEIKNPGSENDAWLILPEEYGEITFGIGETHSHYDWFEFDMQYLEWEIQSFLLGSMYAVSIYAGDEWMGSTTYHGNLDEMTYRDFLKLFHLPPEFKAELKEKGGKVVATNWDLKKSRTIFSEEETAVSGS